LEIKIRVCLEKDIDTLQRIGCETYKETFGSMNSAETMTKYLAEAFDRNKILTELRNSSSNFYFLYADDDLAGYLKVNDTFAQTDIHDAESLEIERIYIKKKLMGNGLGTMLIDYAERLATEMEKKYLWLGVWEKNLSAIAFYKKMGFLEWRRHSFQMGDELQSDLILKKPL
jgi:ribosomal protein S18 acetylase RimI-like enzyme